MDDAFEFARRHETELNGRQREILALIARGHTNPEIAELLGLTLSAAKWNVSEILAKLGLETREDAAAYWAWRQRPAVRAGRWMRAVGGLPLAAKWAAAGAAGALAVGATALLWAGRDGETTTAATPPFVLEATIRVTENASGAGTRVSFSTVRWWFRDATHYRWEI